MGREINDKSKQAIAEVPAGMLTFIKGSFDCGSARQRNKQVFSSVKCRLTRFSKYISSNVDLPTVTLVGVVKMQCPIQQLECKREAYVLLINDQADKTYCLCQRTTADLRNGLTARGSNKWSTQRALQFLPH